MTESDPHGTDLLGPVDFLVVEFPDGKLSADGFETILELSRDDTIRVLDLEFVKHDDTGALVLLDADEVSGDPRLADLAGAGSGLLDEDDLSVLAGLVDPAASAAIIVVENTWTLRFAAGLAAHGARLLATGGIDVQDLDEALADAD